MKECLEELARQTRGLGRVIRLSTRTGNSFVTWMALLPNRLCNRD